MKKVSLILTTALAMLSVASCGFDPAKDTAKFLDDALAAVNDHDDAKAAEGLNDFASKLDGLSPEDEKAFFEAYWSYRENYGEGNYGSQTEFDALMERTLFAADVPSTATFLSELLNGAWEAEHENGFRNLALIFERQCYNGDHDRQLAMRDKREAWVKSMQKKEESKKAEEPAPEPEAVEEESFSPTSYANSVMEAFYRAAAAADFEEYCGIDYGCGEADWFTEAQWEEYCQAEEAWKKANPQKWAVIRAYRKALIADGNALCIIDVD